MQGHYDAIILDVVAHQKFIDMGEKGIPQLTRPEGMIFDLKYILLAESVDLRFEINLT